MEHIKDSTFDGKKDKKRNTWQDPKPWPPEWLTGTLTTVLQRLSNTEKEYVDFVLLCYIQHLFT